MSYFLYSFDETGEKFTVRQGNCLILASHNCKTDLTDKKYLTIHAQLAILAKHSTVEIHSLLTDAHGTQYLKLKKLALKRKDMCIIEKKSKAESLGERFALCRLVCMWCFIKIGGWIVAVLYWSWLDIPILAKHLTVEIHSPLTDDAHGTQYPKL